MNTTWSSYNMTSTSMNATWPWTTWSDTDTTETTEDWCQAYEFDIYQDIAYVMLDCVTGDGLYTEYWQGKEYSEYWKYSCDGDLKIEHHLTNATYGCDDPDWIIGTWTNYIPDSRYNLLADDVYCPNGNHGMSIST